MQPSANPVGDHTGCDHAVLGPIPLAAIESITMQSGHVLGATVIPLVFRVEDNNSHYTVDPTIFDTVDDDFPFGRHDEFPVSPECRFTHTLALMTAGTHATDATMVSAGARTRRRLQTIMTRGILSFGGQKHSPKQNESQYWLRVGACVGSSARQTANRRPRLGRSRSAVLIPGAFSRLEKSKMGKRSGMPESPEAAAKLPISELDRWIAHLEWRFQSVHNSTLRRSAFKSLIWLESLREQHHVIEAPIRELPARRG